MAGSINKACILGNIGKSPEIRVMQSGGKIANFSVATTDSWKDRTTGEKRDKTEWHRVIVFAPPLVNLCEKYLSKGSKVYIEGQLQTRKWIDNNGVERYITEIVLNPYRGEIVLLNRNNEEKNSYDNFSEDSFSKSSPAAPSPSGSGWDSNSIPNDLNDDIPF